VRGGAAAAVAGVALLTVAGLRGAPALAASDPVATPPVAPAPVTPAAATPPASPPSPAIVITPPTPVTLVTPPTPRVTPRPFTVTQVQLTTGDPSGTSCLRTGLGYACRFTVWVGGRNGHTGSQAAGTLSATAYGVGGRAQARSAAFSVTLAPGTSSASVSLNLTFAFPPCASQRGAAPPSLASAAIHQPNAVQSPSVSFGATCP
jgi:hypothetical protein